MPLQKLPVVGLDDLNHQRRARETLNNVLDHSFDDSRVQTAAEIAAGITPINKAYPPGDVRRYGAVSDDATDSTAAIANALLVAAVNGGTVYVGEGSGYLCTANLSVPVGNGNTVDIVGSGWASGGIRFQGASVTTGITFAGSGYSYAGSVKNCRIRGSGSALRGVTFTDVTNGRVERCYFSNVNGAGVAFLGTLMGVLDHCLFTSCGSLTEGAVEVDTFGSVLSTTFKWDHSYISTCNTTVGGLIINRTYHVTILGGAIETSGICLRIGNKSDSTLGCVGGIIHGLDMENPGNTHFYMELGAGLSTVFINSYDIRGCNGSPSGTTTVQHAVSMSRCNGVTFAANNFAVPNGDSVYELESTGNFGVEIAPHRNLFDSAGIPWVRINGVQQMAAGPQTAWSQSSVLEGLTVEKTISGANPNCNVSSTQGGYHARLLMFNGAATNMATLTGGQEGCIVYLRAGNANTTIVHNPGVADAFRLTGGVNLTPSSGQLYGFIRGATDWVQIA